MMDFCRLFLYFTAVLLYSDVPAVLCDKTFCTYAFRDYKYACNDHYIQAKCRKRCDNRPMTCYDCSALKNPESCNTTKLCAPQQKCLLTGYIDHNFEKRYNLTCAPISHCSSFGNSSKRNELHLSGYCCNHDSCNNQLIPPAVPTRDPNICEDITSDGCRYLYYKQPSVCDPSNHHRIADTRCPVTCGTCLNCYRCGEVGVNQTCTNTVTCPSGQVMYIAKMNTVSRLKWPGNVHGKKCTPSDTLVVSEGNKCIIASEFNIQTFQPIYRMGCAAESICSQFTGIGSGVSGTCCSSNLCNVPAILAAKPTESTTTESTTTETTTPTTTSTTQQTTHTTTTHQTAPTTTSTTTHQTTPTTTTSTTHQTTPTTTTSTTHQTTPTSTTTHQTTPTTTSSTIHQTTPTSTTTHQTTPTTITSTIHQTTPTTTTSTTHQTTPTTTTTTTHQTTPTSTTTHQTTPTTTTSTTHQTTPTSTLPPATILTTTHAPTTHVTYPTLSCDIDFIQVGGSCYYFNPPGRTEIWDDAKVICMVLGSHLVEFETKNEENEMKNYIFAQHGNDRHYSYWTGGVKNHQTGNWTWDTTGSLIQSLQWYGGKETYLAGHDCLEYGPMYDYQWNNGDCKLLSNFICEKN